MTLVCDLPETGLTAVAGTRLGGGRALPPQGLVVELLEAGRLVLGDVGQSVAGSPHRGEALVGQVQAVHVLERIAHCKEKSTTSRNC